MNIRLNTYTGSREYRKGSLTRAQAMALRAITLEHPTAIFHTHGDRVLRTGRRGPWTVAWSINGHVMATHIKPDGSGGTA